jgi:hypothetical protein
MPRYFFNTDGGPYPAADEGVDLKGPKEARSEAVIHAGEMLKDIDGQFWDKPEWRMHVTDEQGATVCILTIKGITEEV